MSGPVQVQLKAAGETLTMNVMSCVKVPTGVYPDYDFTGIDSVQRLVVLRVPEASMKRQLTRLELAPDTVVGKTLTFSRDPNPSAPTKPYWGISYADAPIKAVAAQKPATSNGGPVEYGPPIHGLDDDAPPPEEPEDATRTPTPGTAKAKLTAIFKLQEVCFKHALLLASEAENAGVPISLEGVSALTAQAMIEANRKGVI